MNKILLITTGGTLACTPTENGLMPTLTGVDIIEYCKYKDEADIDICDFKLIDSSIMTDEDRAELAEIIWGNRDDYDAFIISHGTDSMAYTAAYLDCALPDFGKSIIITGAQLPLPQEGTDAVENLNLAVEAAMEGYVGTCLAIWRRLIPAKSATKMETEGFEAFESVTKTYTTEKLSLPQGERKLVAEPQKKVGLIYITPNLDRETISRYADFDAVLVLVLGSGGMPKHQEAAFDRLKEKGVKVYIKSQCLFGKVEAIYEAHSGVNKFISVVDTSIDWAVYAIMFGVI
ncbi:MAG: asparaginase [Oscillospiraceae bacterium]|nr:asparaginase [Oscillospiraceae bacterium]